MKTLSRGAAKPKGIVQRKLPKKAAIAFPRPKVGEAKKAPAKAAPAQKATTLPGKSKKAAPGAGTAAGGVATKKGYGSEAVVGLLRQPGGATVAQMVAASGWQDKSVRAYMCVLRKTHGLTITKVESGAGPSHYRAA